MISVKRVGRITRSIDKTTTHAAQSDFHAVLIRQPHARTNDINARPFRITTCQPAREPSRIRNTSGENLPVHVHSSAQWDDEVRDAVRDLSGRFSTTEGDRDRRGGTRSGECHRIRWNQLLVKLDCISASEAIVQGLVNNDELTNQAEDDSCYEKSEIVKDFLKISPVSNGCCNQRNDSEGSDLDYYFTEKCFVRVSSGMLHVKEIFE